MALKSERRTHPATTIPAKVHWDTPEECSSSFAKPARLSLTDLTAHTYQTQRSSLASPLPGSMPHPLHPMEVAATESTKFSDVHSNHASHCGHETGAQKKKGSSGRRKLKMGSFNLLKRLPAAVTNRRKRPLSEAQLRRRVKRSAERGDWDAVRKAISNYEFAELPELTKKQLQAKRESFASIISEKFEESSGKAGGSSRRPSYGSAHRRSFTGKESAAAAAVITAAFLEESSCSAQSFEQHEVLNAGESILHDVCRYNPPLDVVETLLKALRHRRGSTTGTDGQGQTPLHVAANHGACTEVIDALVRTDPSPASMGDVDGRSPLHLVVKFLAQGGYNPAPHGRKHTQEKLVLSQQEAEERTHKTVLLLKEAMLTYPGKIGFRDEDETGYSPLDYAIDGNVSKEDLVHSLLRRKEPTKSRARRSSSVSMRRNRNFIRRLTRESSGSDGVDIEVLCQLEQDEIEARRHRIEKMKKKKRKEVMNDALFDVFGIEEQQPALPTAAPTPEPEVVEPQEKSEGSSQEADEDIYHRHLQEYLEDYGGFGEEFEGLCEADDGFDIFEDPSQARIEAEATANPSAVEEINLPSVIMIGEDDDDCASVVSEITVPVGSRRSSESSTF